MKTHQEIDARSLAMHRLAVRKLREEPERFECIKENLRCWRPETSLRALPYLEAWEALARQGMEACLVLAVEESERADAMRQSSPFAGVLTDHERFAFLREWKEKHAA
jgi:hypothetical protein